MEKVARYALIVLLVALHATGGIPEGFLEWSPLARCAAYSFYHANWWHLAVNCLAVWTIYARGCRPGRDLLLPYLIAMAVFPLAPRPVIGISNLLYAVIGLRTPSLSSPWWRQGTTITFLLATLAMVFIPRIAGLTHIYAFAAGVFLAGAGRIFRELTRDSRRYL